MILSAPENASIGGSAPRSGARLLDGKRVSGTGSAGEAMLNERSIRAWVTLGSNNECWLCELDELGKEQWSFFGRNRTDEELLDLKRWCRAQGLPILYTRAALAEARRRAAQAARVAPSGQRTIGTGQKALAQTSGVAEQREFATA